MIDKLRYKDLTPEEKEFICDGCGPKGWFIPIPEFIFTDACNRHDFNYWLGNTKKDRKKADKQFYLAMKEEASIYTRRFTRLWYRSWAWVYYKAVRTWGGNFFHFAETERTRADLKKAMEIGDRNV